MEFLVLGPIEARHADAAVAAGGGRQLALLALLLMNAGQVVSRDRLVDQLWHGVPPPGAPRSLDAYVSRLRRALREAGAGELIETRAPGYLLRGEVTDARRFLTLAVEGREALAAGDAGAAAERLRAALALWRGRAYLEVADEPWARAEVESLEGWRLSAVEDRIDADLALGRHAPVVPELEMLVTTHATHERFVGQLMLALYRCGRQTDALATFRRARAALVEDLGLEPGPALRALEAAVLRHDPTLDVPVQSTTRPPAPVPRVRRNGRRVVTAAFLAVIAAVAAAATIVVVMRPAERASALTAEGVDALDPRSGRVVASVAVGAEPAAIAAAGGRIWIADDVRDTVSRIDPRGAHVEQTLPVGSAPIALAAAAGALWVANARGGTLSRVDPQAGAVVQTIPAGTRPAALAAGEGAVWVADAGASALIVVDPRSGAVRRRIRLSAQPEGIAVGFGSVWVTEPTRRRLVRIDPRSGAVLDEIDVGGGAGAIAAGSGAIWVVNRLDGTVSRIDPVTDAVSATTPVGTAPAAVAAGPSAVWVADAGGLVALDPHSGALRTRHAVGAAPEAVTLLDGQPWVATGVPVGRAHRGGTLRVVTSDDLSLIDPAFSGNLAPGIWRAMGDGLVALTVDAGADQLVPDLAVALPRPSDHGRAYAFRLRPGMRYWTGAPVRPSDFRRAFERLFAARSPAAVMYDALVGAARCNRRPDRCDLSHGVVADDRAGTVVLHLTRREPLLAFRLADPAARPVPPGTPRDRAAARPVPSTGPYRVARFTPGRELGLERNPHFLAWSTAAQPDGYPSRIEIRYVADADARVSAVRGGRADVAIDVTLARSLRDLQTRFSSQLRPHAQPFSLFYPLNVRRPPFSDVRARQALNLALDRVAIARRFGGPTVSTPICEILPAGIPGHIGDCPWTRRPHDGRWHGPDVRRARTLVRASGSYGAVVRYVANGNDPAAAQTAPTIASALRRVGYHPRILLPRDYARLGPALARGAFDVSFASWIPGFPSASEFLHPFLSCAAYHPENPVRTTNSGGWCDPAFDRLIAGAEAAEIPDQPRAERLWTRAERRTVERAPLVPAITSRSIELVSRRTGHFTLDASSQLRFDQLWVH